VVYIYFSEVASPVTMKVIVLLSQSVPFSAFYF